MHLDTFNILYKLCVLVLLVLILFQVKRKKIVSETLDSFELKPADPFQTAELPHEFFHEIRIVAVEGYENRNEGVVTLDRAYNPARNTLRAQPQKRVAPERTLLLTELSSDQRAIMDVVLSTEWPSNQMLVIGKAGSGKSALLKLIRQNLKNVVVAAPTGIAALNVGGVTLHKLFRLRPQVQSIRDHDYKPFERDSIQYEILDRMQVLIIDEISMVRCDVMDAIDKTLRRTFDSDEPFAGKKILLFGDPMQLPPVVAKDRNYLSPWAGEFFFDAKVWSTCFLKVFELTHVHRQGRDKEFASLLNEIREGNYANIETLNQMASIGEGEIDALHLVTTNKLAKARNDKMLSLLRSPTHKVRAVVVGEFRETPADLELTLLEGARVLITANGSGYVNGSRGVFRKFNAQGAEVELDDSGAIVTVTPNCWEETAYIQRQNSADLEAVVVGQLYQIPLRLGWAITIHKSQGLTLDRAVINFGDRAFDHGQAYVALSRLKSRDGLTLRRKIRDDDIKVSRRVAEFLHGVRNGLWPKPQIVEFAADTIIVKDDTIH